MLYPFRLPDPMLAAVEALEGVTRIAASAKQVLVHPHHVPIGLFIVVEGVLVLSDGRGEERVRAGGFQGLVMIPELGELESAAARSARIEPGTVVLFVPRSLPLTDRQARALLEALPARRVSLQRPCLAFADARRGA